MIPSPKQLLRRSLLALLGRYGYTLAYAGTSSLGDNESVNRLAAHLRELFEAMGINVVLDVGANRGQYHDLLRDRVGYQGPIYSFEPVAELYEELSRRRRGDQLWEIFPYALGSESGQKEFNVATNSGWSSFHTVRNDADTEVAKTAVSNRVETVEVRRLDEVIAEVVPSHATRNVFLKVDAQGHDLYVLQGGLEMLKSVRAIQTELELVSVYADVPSYLSMLEFLRDHDFYMTIAVPIWHDENLRIGEMDVVFRELRAATDQLRPMARE